VDSTQAPTHKKTKGKTTTKHPAQSLHDHNDYIHPLAHIHGYDDVFPKKNLKQLFDEVEYNSPVPEREEPKTIGIGGEKEHHEKAHMKIYDHPNEILNLDPWTLEDDLKHISVINHGPS
jgi:hypothetical protein